MRSRAARRRPVLPRDLLKPEDAGPFEIHLKDTRNFWAATDVSSFQIDWTDENNG